MKLFLLIFLGLFSSALAVTDSIGLNISSDATVRYVTVKSFTAQGIQDAIDQVSSSNGEIYLPAGVYDMRVTANANANAKVLINKSVNLSGAGIGTVISAVSANGTTMFDVSSNDISISNMYFYGSDTTNGELNDGKIGVNNTSGIANRLTVENCYFRAWAEAISSTVGNASVNWKIKNNTFEFAGSALPSPNYAIHLNGQNFCSIENNYFDNIDGTSVFLDASLNTTIFGNRIIVDTGGARAIWLNAASYSVVSGNSIDSQTTGTLLVEIGGSTDSSVVVGNSLDQGASGTEILNGGTNTVAASNS